MNSSRKLNAPLWRRIGGALLSVAIGAAGLSGAACQPDVTFTESKTFAGGREVTGKELTQGHDAYMLYCYACHGEKGDGHGPSSYGLRPPPRDFTKGIFKFARLRSSDELPNDEDLFRIVQGGLHGTAMLAWDIPDVELDKIFQYIKTFAPQKWEKKKKDGSPVKTLEEFDASKAPDPWTADEAGAIEFGRDLYHFRAECVNCHPAYGTKAELYGWSVAASKKDPTKFKPLGGFRDDIYGSVAKDSTEYNMRILPPDFAFTPLRSIREGSELVDLFRLISYGVYPVMPAWQGAGLDDRDIWALAHYVRSLMRMKEEASPALADMRRRIATQPAFEVPKAAPPEAEKKPGDQPAEGAAKKDEKPAEPAPGGPPSPEHAPHAP